MKNTILILSVLVSTVLLSMLFLKDVQSSDDQLIALNDKALQQPPRSIKVIGYYPEWAIYRKPAFKPADINTDLVTHINYAFAKVDTKGNVSLFDDWAATGYRSDWNTEKPYWGNFRQLQELKQKHPELKILISIGGWTLSDPFSEMAASKQTRANFVQKSIQFAKQYGFDGIDIDWEYPGFAEHSGRPEDTQNFTLLLSELYSAAKAQNPPLLVTFAAPAGYNHYQRLELEKIHQYLDWVNLMTYDFHGPWGGSGDPVTNHNAPLYPPKEGDPKLCAEAAVGHYISHGFPPEKIVLGMPLYGRTFAKANTTPTGLFSQYQGPGTSSPEADPGMRFFSDCKRNLMKVGSGYTRYWDQQAKVPYLYNPSTEDFVSFDDEESLKLKAQLVNQYRLGGAMVWELGQDTIPEWDGMHAINSALQK